MNSKIAIRSLSLCLLLLGTGSAATGQGLLSRLPDSTIAMLRIEDGTAWTQTYPTTSISKVIQSDAFKPLQEYLAIGGIGERALDRVGLRSKDIQRLSKGEVIFARVLLSNQQRASLAAFEVDEATAQNVMKDIEQTLIARGAKKQTLPTKDGFKTHLTTPDGKLNWIYAYASGSFSVCDNVELAGLPRVPTASSLAANRQLQTTMQRTKFHLPEDSAIEAQWLIRPWELFTDPRSETVDRLLGQGFDAIQSAGGRLRFSKNQTEHRTFVLATKPLRKSASGLAFRQQEVPEVPAWISPDVTSCLATHIDFLTALSGYGHWFDETHGGGDEGLFDIVLDDIRDEPGSPGVDIRKDLVQQLDGPLLSLAINGDDNTASRIFAVAVKNEEVVSQAVAGLLKGDPDVLPITIKGFAGWKFGDLSRRGTRQILGPDLSGLSICLAHGYLMSCPNEDTLRKVLSASKNDTRSDSFSKRLRDAAQSLNAQQPIGIGFSQNLGQIGDLYQRILGNETNSPTIVPELLRAFQFDANDREIKTFQSKLPSTKVVSSLFGRSIDSAEDNNDGWLLKGTVSRKE